MRIIRIRIFVIIYNQQQKSINVSIYIKWKGLMNENY